MSVMPEDCTRGGNLAISKPKNVSKSADGLHARKPRKTLPFATNTSICSGPPRKFQILPVVGSLKNQHGKVLFLLSTWKKRPWASFGRLVSFWGSQGIKSGGRELAVASQVLGNVIEVCLFWGYCFLDGFRKTNARKPSRFSLFAFSSPFLFLGGGSRQLNRPSFDNG